MTVRELERRVGVDELAEWRAYSGLEPFGPWREDQRAALVASAAVAPYREKGSKPMTTDDLLPRPLAHLEDEPEKPATDDLVIKARIASAAAAVGARTQ